MQNLNYLQPTGLIKTDRETINSNMETIASNFSGTVFPTSNLTAGMFCFRTDTNKLYILKPDLTSWVQLVDFNTGVVYVPSANNADSANKATNDVKGQPIVSTYVKSLSINGSTITVTKGDGKESSFVTPNTTYDIFTGASISVSGKAGLVPAPVSGQTTRFLRSDGTWFDIGTGKIGSATKPVYMSDSKIVESDASVGSGVNPVYMSNGAITPSKSNVAKSNQIMYMSGGELKAGTNFDSMYTLASTQGYRQVGINSANVYDQSTGGGVYSSYSLEIQTGLGAGTRSLQAILQELINRSHSHTVTRHLYNCQCQCDCDCSDNDN